MKLLFPAFSSLVVKYMFTLSGIGDKNAMKSRNFTVIVYKEEEMYIAECPEVGTVDQGYTIEEAIANLKEATRLYLEEFPLPETSPRYITSIEVKYA